MNIAIVKPRSRGEFGLVPHRADADESCRTAVREWPHQHALNYRENCSIGAHAECQAQDGQRRHARRFAKLTHGVTQVREKCLHGFLKNAKLPRPGGMFPAKAAETISNLFSDVFLEARRRSATWICPKPAIDVRK